MIYCATLEKWGLWNTKDCCISCIEEMNSGYHSGCALGNWRETPVLNEWSMVCCAAAGDPQLKRRLTGDA